jgi:tRNA/tmRNA/rRNA uracil-C5-methylase (TrmA/RlmC/RlmD family)
LRESLPNVESILIQDRRADKFELFGPGYLTYSAGGAYRVGHLSFFQVNRFLVEDADEAVVGNSRGRLALDLFAGVGLFTVALAKQFDRVIGVESNLAAAKDLEVNLQESGGASPARACSRRRRFLSHWHETPDLVVLDPPRAGVEPEALGASQETRARAHPLRFLRSGHFGARSRRARGHEDVPAHTRSIILICLTFSHKPIIWRCWCG